MRPTGNPGVEEVVIDGSSIGFSLGADYCSEHEWGIKKLKERFNIQYNEIGLKGRQITSHRFIDFSGTDEKDYNSVGYFEVKNNLFCLAASEHAVWDLNEDGTFKQKTKDWMIKQAKVGKNGLGAAWSEGDFCLAGTEVWKPKIQSLYEAFLQNDVALFLGGGGFFTNPGLTLLIASKIPADTIAVWEKADTNRKELKEASEGTGIEAKLKTAGKKFYALSPKWASEFKKETKYPVIFWLNPMEQDKYDSNWFSVEELEQWVQDKGPVLRR